MLVLITVASLVQAAVFPDPARAQADRHRAGTFNMQGAQDRWQQGVFPAAKQVEVLALQEVPDAMPPDAELADGVYVNRLTPLAHGFTVERYRWDVGCRTPLPGPPQRSTCVIYKVRSLTRQNRSLAVIVNQPADGVRAVQVIPPQPLVPGGTVDTRAKPALGIRLADGTWFYSLHAMNRQGSSQRNDVPSLISKISAAAGSSDWAAMGDFNRTPDSLLASDYPDAEIVRSELPTYPVKGPASEFDYMIAKGLTDNQYTGFRLTYLDASDHYPVGFWPSAAPPTPRREFACDPIDEILRAGRAVCVPTKNPAIVSLGDSYISGEAGRWAGNAGTGVQGSVWGTDRAAANCSRSEDECDHDLDTVYGPTSYSPGGNACDRSDVAPISTTAYPGVPSWRRFNIACSGATTNEITRPYTAKGEDAQTDQLADLAKRYQVKMIVVSIGGNDLGFKDIITDCAERFMKWPFYAYCKNADAWSDMNSRLDAVGDKVTRALAAIQTTMQHAGYRADDYRLVVQSYPAPLPPSTAYRYNESRFTRYSNGGCPFYDVDTDWARQTLVGGMSREIKAAANSVRAKFLDVSDAFAGHELCNKASAQATQANSSSNPLPSQAAEWVRWVPYLPDHPALNGAPQGDIQEAVHPNSFGQLALGTCLTKVSNRTDLLNNTATAFTCANDGRNGKDGMTVTGNGIFLID
ncbi:hypothetical protein [Streptomyces sp. NPDC021622]|uniref:hypothetical protein n=1 Tax=Streptomyces sp. NPDC021622 TaxID=3155013 RepID=UPI0033E36DDA